MILIYDDVLIQSSLHQLESGIKLIWCWIQNIHCHAMNWLQHRHGNSIQCAELQELYLSRVIASYHDHRHYLMCIVTIVRLNLYLTWSSKIIKRFIYVVQSLELIICYCIFIVFRANLFSALFKIQPISFDAFNQGDTF